MATSKQSISARLIRGMTLIELMVGLVIVGMGMTIAVPSFQGMLARNTMATQVNEFLLTVNRARSAASAQGGPVSVQALDAVEDNEFGAGWCIVSGNPGNCNAGVIMRVLPIAAESTLIFATSGATAIEFDAMGALADATALDIDLCRAGHEGRRIHISAVGRSKSHKPTDPSISRQPYCP